MEKLITIFDIRSDSFYDIDENEEYKYDVSDKKPKQKEYEEIKPLTKAQKAKIYLKSILYKIDFKRDVYEDLEHYYYICNKCEMMVYYFERDLHLASHLEDKSVCCNCVIL